MDYKNLISLALACTLSAGLFAQSGNADAQVTNSDETAKSGIEFSYEAGAELVSSYLWRGQYNGGLSLQPTVSVGYEGENTSLSVGAWASVGASDWMFRKGEPYYTFINDDGDEEYDGTPNTYFVPELDLFANFDFFGASLGATYYQYFSWMENTRKFDPNYQLEVTLQYSLEHFLEIPLYVQWNTMVSATEFDYHDIASYASYLEIGYQHAFPYDITLGGKIGMSPWANDTYKNSRFAVVNLDLRLEKAWEFDACQLTLFAEGSINPHMEQDAFVWEAGDDKLYNQPINGTIGLGIWF